MNSLQCFSNKKRDFDGLLLLKSFFLLFLLACYGCDNEKSFSADRPVSLETADIAETSDENMYTSINGDFMVDYDIEFLPYSEEEGEEEMPAGVLRISSLRRCDKDSCWVVSQQDCQRVEYPIENTLPLFLITDNLQIEDDKEGYMLSFYNLKGELLRTASYSVEEWLVIISRIRQSHYGYLPIDLSHTPEDMLIKDI